MSLERHLSRICTSLRIPWEYATAIRQGAPQALQVLDRFHLIQNLAKAVKLRLSRCRDEIGSTQWHPLTPPHIQRAQQARRSQRLNQYQQVMALSKEGVKDAEIAHRTKLSVRTIRRWRAHDSFPEVKHRQRRSRFDPYKEYVLRRWQEGCTNGYQLWRELRAQGYRGSARSVYNFLQPLSKGLVAPVLQQKLACFSPQETTWLFIRDPSVLDEKQQKRNSHDRLSARPNLPEHDTQTNGSVRTEKSICQRGHSWDMLVGRKQVMKDNQ